MIIDPVPAGGPEAALAAFGSELVRAFSNGPSALRIALLALTGIILSIGAMRTRRTLHRAVAREDVGFKLSRVPWPYTEGDARWLLSRAGGVPAARVTRVER